MSASWGLHILIYGLALWLGLYLLARDPRKPRLRYTGLGLIAYALEIAAFSLVVTPTTEFPFDTLIASVFLEGIFPFVPALCWFFASSDFLPDDHPLHPYLRVMVFALIVLLAFLAFITRTRTVAILVSLLLLAALWLVWQAYRAARTKHTLGALLVVAIFFGLSNGLLLVPTNIIPLDVALAAIGLDLVLLGLLIAVLDAFDEGEALLPDMLYSFTISAVMAILFGGQAALAIAIGGGMTLPLLILLYGLVTAALATQTLYSRIQGAVDRLVFARFARLRQARADLRAASEGLPRVNEALDVVNMDEAEFARLTRRALSHFGDLNRLSSSPLTRLPLIDVGLAERGAPDNTLERAAELKSLLAESIARLKPRNNGEFGTSDEWRYYNALYYPYVLGLKPYSYNAQPDSPNAAAKAVLDWFQVSVPERTLHNWQNAAARLIAQDLREQMRDIGSKWQ